MRRPGAGLILLAFLAGCSAGPSAPGTAPPAANTPTSTVAATPPAGPASATPASSNVPGPSTGILLAATPPPESPFTGFTAPDFSRTDLAGQQVQLRAYRGHPVWLNLWATWCVPCQHEMPAMQTLYDQYRDQGLVILGINAQEDPARVQQFVQTGGFSWQFVLDPDNVVRHAYYFSAVPSHVFIDRAGVIRGLVIGELDPAGMQTQLHQILPDPRSGGG